METTKVAGVDVFTAHCIDGKRVASKRTFEVRSPIDGTHLADVSAGGAEEVDAAVAAARRAFPAWAARGPEGRHPILKRFAQAIRDHAQELSAVETADNGSLLIANATRIVPRAAHNIEFFADYALKLNHETIDSPEVVNHVCFDPAGVVALMTPWNAPFMLTTWKVGPCLTAGNTAVVKPPEWAHRIFSLMQICGDRLTLGVGAGSTETDFIAFERDYAKRFKTFNATLARLKTPLAEGKDERANLTPWKTVIGGPPLVLGSWGAGVERAAKDFDSWVASAHYRTADQVIAALGRYRAAEGKRAIGSTIQLTADHDLGRSRDILQRFADAGFDDAVVLLRPGGPSPVEVRALIK